MKANSVSSMKRQRMQYEIGYLGRLMFENRKKAYCQRTPFSRARLIEATTQFVLILCTLNKHNIYLPSIYTGSSDDQAFSGLSQVTYPLGVLKDREPPTLSTSGTESDSPRQLLFCESVQSYMKDIENICAVAGVPTLAWSDSHIVDKENIDTIILEVHLPASMSLYTTALVAGTYTKNSHQRWERNTEPMTKSNFIRIWSVDCPFITSIHPCSHCMMSFEHMLKNISFKGIASGFRQINMFLFHFS